VSDPWVAVLRTVEGNNVERSTSEAAAYEGPTAFHVVICRESAVVKGPINNWVSESLNGLPDSHDVAHWFDAHHIASRPDLRMRFVQAEAMAVGLNEWEAIQ
jgi:hypothetical protein